MAAMLAEIKSRMLLPRSVRGGGGRGRPARAAHSPPAGVRAVQEGRRGHRGAAARGARHLGRQRQAAGYQPRAAGPGRRHARAAGGAGRGVLRRADMFESHHIQREALSTRERMSGGAGEPGPASSSCPSSHCSGAEEGRLGVVVTFPGGHGADQGVPGGNRADRSLRSHPRQGKVGITWNGNRVLQLVQITRGRAAGGGQTHHRGAAGGPVRGA